MPKKGGGYKLDSDYGGKLGSDYGGKLDSGYGKLDSDYGKANISTNGENLVKMKNDLAKIEAEQKLLNPKKKVYGLFDAFTDNKKNVPTKAIQLHNPTVFAVVTSVIYLLVHIIIYKQTEFKAWKIFGIIFVWPIFIEFISRFMKDYLFLPWLLSIGPLIGFISYTIYKFRNAVNTSQTSDEDKNKKIRI